MYDIPYLCIPVCICKYENTYKRMYVLGNIVYANQNIYREILPYEHVCVNYKLTFLQHVEIIDIVFT